MQKKLLTFMGSVADFPVSEHYKRKFQESEIYRNSCITFAKALCEGTPSMMSDLSAALLIAEYIVSQGQKTELSDPNFKAFEELH